MSRGRMTCLARLAASLAIVMGLGGCGSPKATPSVRPSPAPPKDVLTSYLAALEVGDCAGARQLAMPSWSDGTDALCGEQVKGFQPIGDGNNDGAGGTIEFGTVVTLGAPVPGMNTGVTDFTLFFVLARQPDGRWLVSEVGTGP